MDYETVLPLLLVTGCGTLICLSLCVVYRYLNFYLLIVTLVIPFGFDPNCMLFIIGFFLAKVNHFLELRPWHKRIIGILNYYLSENLDIRMIFGNS